MRLAVLGLLLAAPAFAQTPDLPRALLDQQAAVNGQAFPGFRVNHAKGALYEGRFDPAPEAAGLSVAPHLQAKPSRLLLRFSNAGGNPEAPDAAPSAAVRGLAFTFTLPDGTATDLMCISVPVFVTRTPEEQLALLRAAAASKPGAPEPTPIRQFVATRPEVQRFLAIPKPMPKSFATEAYYALHAYRLTNAKGESRFVRFRVIPEAGLEFFEADEVPHLPRNALFEEMASRLLDGPARFRLVAQVARPGDPTADPTQAWPEDRQQVVLGTITVAAAVPDSAEAERKVGFLPNRALPGLAMSDDPFLQVRAEVYGIAFPARQ